MCWAVGTYLDPGCPLHVTRHVQQLVHVDLQLWYGLLLQQHGKKGTVSSFFRNMERKPSSSFSFSAVGCFVWTLPSLTTRGQRRYITPNTVGDNEEEKEEKQYLKKNSLQLLDAFFILDFFFVLL